MYFFKLNAQFVQNVKIENTTGRVRESDTLYKFDISKITLENKMKLAIELEDYLIKFI
jgi:hypothetical protein